MLAIVKPPATPVDQNDDSEVLEQYFSNLRNVTCRRAALHQPNEAPDSETWDQIDPLLGKLSQQYQAFAAEWDRNAPLFPAGLTIIVGGAGAGKSHLVWKLYNAFKNDIDTAVRCKYRGAVGLTVGEPYAELPAITSINQLTQDVIVKVGRAGGVPSTADDYSPWLVIIDSISTIMTARELSDAAAYKGGESSALIPALIDMNNAFVTAGIAGVATINFHDFRGSVPDLAGSIAASVKVEKRGEDRFAEFGHYRIPDGSDLRTEHRFTATPEFWNGSADVRNTPLQNTELTALMKQYHL